MALVRQLMGSGLSGSAARHIAGTVNSTTSGAGTTSADATVLSYIAIQWIKTAANNSGVKLPAGMNVGDSMVIYNGDSNTLLLYPPTSGTLNGGTATTGTVSIPTHTSVTVTSLNGTNFVVSGPTT